MRTLDPVCNPHSAPPTVIDVTGTMCVASFDLLFSHDQRQ